MKTIFILILLFAATNLLAQDVPPTPTINNSMGDPSKQVQTKTNIGTLIGQLTDNLRDEAFTDEFKANKDYFISSVSNSDDAGFLSGALEKLQMGIKPEALKNGWENEMGDWQNDARTATSSQSLAGALKRLEQYIAPAMFKGDWAKYRPVWDQALNGLAM